MDGNATRLPAREVIDPDLPVGLAQEVRAVKRLRIRLVFEFDRDERYILPSLSLDSSANDGLVILKRLSQLRLEGLVDAWQVGLEYDAKVVGIAASAPVAAEKVDRRVQHPDLAAEFADLLLVPCLLELVKDDGRAVWRGVRVELRIRALDSIPGFCLGQAAGVDRAFPINECVKPFARALCSGEQLHSLGEELRRETSDTLRPRHAASEYGRAVARS